MSECGLEVCEDPREFELSSTTRGGGGRGRKTDGGGAGFVVGDGGVGGLSVGMLSGVSDMEMEFRRLS
ncbi:hypothetical protein T439DRAFT_327005 [Meredithblackwellia eburnea MCA 4105]